MANRPSEISRDHFFKFCADVYEASPTVLEFDEYYEMYEELLRMLFWNPDLDTPIAVGRAG